MRYTLARCKEKRNHSKSAHISQRSFLYGEIFFWRNNNSHHRWGHRKTKNKKQNKKQQIRGGKNEKRHNIRWMKGWRDYHTQWKVWQLRLEMRNVSKIIIFQKLPISVHIMIHRRHEVTGPAFNDLHRCLGEAENNFEQILISTHVHLLCVRVGGAQAIVWLSLFHHVEQ